MDNATIARLLQDMGHLLEIEGANPFKIRAYGNAVQAIESLHEPLRDIHQRGELESIDGIGKGIAEKIAEYIENGAISELDELKSRFPEKILDLLEISGMGPKKVKLVYDELGIGSVDELKQAAEDGKLRDLPKMGEKSEEKILKAIQNRQQSTGRHTLSYAAPAAFAILERVSNVKGVKQAEIAGSLRRGRETVGDIDILVSAKNPQTVMDEFLSVDGIEEVLAKGKTKSSIVVGKGLQIDLRVVDDQCFGAALQYFTGSKEHNVKVRERAVKRKLKVSEYGVFKEGDDKPIAGKTEEDVYKALNLVWIPPELREGGKEIEWAESGNMPELVELGDLRGALHNHTTASDGVLSLKELAEEAKERGFSYFAVTDHSGSLGIANGLSPDRLKRQIDEVRKFNESADGIHALAGSEVDIKADGSLDFDDDLLSRLDIVIASIHVSLEQSRDKMTDRILRALDNPYVDILAHPTGRLIGKRPPIEFDEDKVFARVAERGTALEINCYPLRLDLHDRHIRQASEHGAIFTINTDTHSVDHFDHLPLGVKTARRGVLAPKQVINTMTYKQFLKWKSKRVP